MPNLTLKIPKESNLHRKIITKLDSRIKFAEQGNIKRREKWTRAEELTLAYLPESEADRLRRADREDKGNPTYTTIQIPYTYAQLMSVHTYISSVFFARSPVHQFSGLHGEGEQQVQAVEALLNYQVVVGEMLAPYYIWIYDVLKYGYGVLGEYWDKQTLQAGQITEVEDPETGRVQKVEVIKEFVGYEGNRVCNISPYDFWTDPRVPANRFQEGEICVWLKRVNWSTVLRRERQGYYMNLEHLRKHASIPPAQQGSPELERPEERDWIGEDFQQEDRHPSQIGLFEVYAEIVPSEWGLGKTDYPMKWVFTLTYDKELLIGATPLGYTHCKYPFMLGESEIEGYGLFSRGIPDIIEPIQNTADWLINSHFFNVRAALNNQFIMDPSKIVVEDAQDGGPGFRYRLRPEAYGGNIDQFFKQVQVQDVTRAHMEDLKVVNTLGERILGANDQIVGSTGGTTRKTATESRISAGFGTNRLKTIAEYMSAAAYAPHAIRLVQNSQQYFDVQKKLRIVGDLAQISGPGFINVNPDAIGGFYEYVPVDGTLPVDRMAQATLWKEILANIRNFPIIAQQYDISRIFAWVATLAGLKNINQFKVQVLPPGVAPTGDVLQSPSGNGLPPPGGTGVEPGNAAATQHGLATINSGY